MSEDNEQQDRKDHPDQVKPEFIEQKVRQEQPSVIIDRDQSAPRGRRPLFRT